MNEIVFMVILTVGTIITGVGLGAFLYAVETWNIKRRMKNAKVFRVKF